MVREGSCGCNVGDGGTEEEREGRREGGRDGAGEGLREYTKESQLV